MTEQTIAISSSYYRARYYDPATGRFLSEDPIGFESGDNFYAYTENNPTNWIDPSGTDIICPSFLPWCKPATAPTPTPPPSRSKFPLHCSTPSECNFTPDMNRALQCFQNCIGTQLIITGGRGPRSKANSSHSRGEACDLGRNSNRGLSPDMVKPCFANCFPHGYGQEERNGPGTPGTHFHFQVNTVPGGQPRFAPGIQPYAP